MSAPTTEELQLVQKFRNHVITILDLKLEEGQSSDQNLLRWIRARENDLEKAEQMLRRHIAWRKANGIGPSILDWIPSQFITDTYNVKFVTFDPSGSPILLLNFGQWDMRKALEKGEKESLIRYKDKILEQIMRLMKLWEVWSQKKGHKINEVTQFHTICNWEGFSLKYIMSKEVVDVILDAARSFEANYPETLKSSFNVNCPKVFTVLFNLVKPFLTERTLSKIFIFDSNAAKWKSAILKTLPASLVPVKFGGFRDNIWDLSKLNLTGLELDPMMEEVLNDSVSKYPDRGGNEGFGDMKFTEVRVSPGYKVNLPNKVTKVGTRISWHFQVEEKDIGFSIFYEDLNKVNQEVVKYERVEEDLGSVICEKEGNYVLSFDNTYSNFKPKIVQYKLSVDNPFSIN